MFLAEKNLWMPMWQDLVVAYVAYEVVRPCYETVVSYLGNRPLLGWWHEDFESFIVRAEGGCLIARNGRLFVFPQQRIDSGTNITISALLE